ncbi:MAG: S8 family serine peptidase [Phycisphaerales bacterium]|nr:S8 family serine peptidase [Phycisphaerales bacterium]
MSPRVQKVLLLAVFCAIHTAHAEKPDDVAGVISPKTGLTSDEILKLTAEDVESLDGLIAPAKRDRAKCLSGALRELAVKAERSPVPIDASKELLSGHSRYGKVFQVDRGAPIVDITVTGDVDAIAARIANIDGVTVTGVAKTEAYGLISARIPAARLVDVSQIVGIRSMHGSSASKGQVTDEHDAEQIHGFERREPDVRRLPQPLQEDARQLGEGAQAQDDQTPVVQGAIPAFQGAANNQAVQGLRLNQARLVFPALDGTGINIGGISDTVNMVDSVLDNNCGGGNCVGLDESQATGDLPPDGQILVLQDGPFGADEGRAMLEHIYDLAPGANRLGFATAFGGEANFANNITDLANNGMDVVVDDVLYFAEPMFQDGVIAQSVNNFINSGRVYLSINHNYANLSYESLWSSSDGDDYHDFSAGDEVQQITLAPGMALTMGLQWSQPWGAATTDLQIELWDSTVTTLLANSSEANVGGNPFDRLDFTNITLNPINVNVAVRRNSGSIAGLTFKYIFYDNGASRVTINEYAGNATGTLTPHAGTQQSISIGAVPFWNTGQAESFSGIGPHRRFFTAGGSPSPATLTKPDFISIDNCNTTFFGNDVPQDLDLLPNFAGTSAAAPNTAAICALMLQAAGGPGSLTQQQIHDILRITSVDLGPAGHDFTYGHGRVDALGAIAAASGPSFSEYTLYPNQFGDASVSLSIDSVIDTDTIEFASDDLGTTTVSVTEFNSLDPMLLVFNDQPNLVAADYNGGFDIDDALVSFDLDFWDVHTAKVLSENNFAPPGNYTISVDAPDQFVGFVTIASDLTGSTASTIQAPGDLDFFRITAPFNLPPNMSRLELTSIPVGFDGILIAYDASGTRLAVGDGIGSGLADSLSLSGVGAGDEIIVLVCAWSYSGTGSYTLDAIFKPRNDSCANPIGVGDGSVDFGNLNATNDGPNEFLTCGATIGADIWYCYTASCNGNLTASTCGSSLDTVVAVYNNCACPIGANAIACNNDACGAQSDVTIGVVAGQQYMIRVGGASSATNGGTLTLSCMPTGACCDGVSCSIETEADCLFVGGTYQGDDTICESNTCTAMGACPGLGNCFVDNGSVGCNDGACCNQVCNVDPYCCSVEWDDVCATKAVAYCTDCNSNGIPDFVDLQELIETDCNGNGVPDKCDIVDRVSEDCNGNDRPDECDIQSGLRPGSLVLFGCDENGGATVFDSSGNGNDGVFAGAGWSNQTPFAEPGNYSLSFNHELDAVTIAAPPGSPLDVFDKLTLEAHILPLDTSSLHYVLWADDGPFSLLIRNDAIEFGLNHQTVIVHPFRAAGIWTHVAAVYDGTVARLYLNGLEVASHSIVLGPIGPVESRDIIRIGNDETADFAGFNRDFGGLIDQVRIVSGALTPAEVLYDATHTLRPGSSSDCNANEIPDECEVDSDGDGVIDVCDPCPADNPDDSDADTVCDSDDICPGFDDAIDPDGDETPTGCDACPFDNPNDSDGDGVCEGVDICPGFDDGLDEDGDGVPDGCDLCPGFDDAIDSDGDGAPDDCDVCDGFDDNADADNDMIPDACDRCGDFDGDQLITNADYAFMPDCMSGPATLPTPQLPLTPDRCRAAFDCDLDGDIDLVDFIDIQATFDGP